MNYNDSTEFSSHIWKQIRTAKDHLDEQEADRQLALEYYDGKINDIPVLSDNESKAISNDLRETVKKVLPSVMRQLFANGKTVDFTPEGPEDEEPCKQATNYINKVVVPENDIERAIYDAVHDAMLLKTGILKWCAYEERHVDIQEYTDQPDEAMYGLEGDPEIEIFDHTKEPETDPTVLELDPNAMRHSFKVRHVTQSTRPTIEAIPRGVFLITPNAETIEEAELVGEEIIASRSRLVEMGYDRDKVSQLSRLNTKMDEGDREEQMGDDYSSEEKQTMSALEDVRIYEVYIKIDTDNDGIAELHRVVMGDERSSTGDESKGQTHIILAHEIVSEAPYADIVIERSPHQFEGHSFYEDVREPMRVKTAILREVMNNLYAQNTPRPAIDTDAVKNADDIMDRTKAIMLNPGRRVDEAVQWQLTPFVGNHGLTMMQYWDEVIRDRTGVTDASGGLDPEQLQNTSATAAHMMGESGYAQAEFIMRSIAGPLGGLRKAFRGLLKLVIAHADRPRTIKLNGKWEQYDPRTWNSNMDCQINVGLGSGTRERDMQMLTIVKQLQMEVIGAAGLDNPMVRPDHVFRLIDKMVETIGLPSSEPYFAEPDMKEIQQRMAQAEAEPTPEQEKMQAQVMIERTKVQAAREKEKAQMEADLITKRADIDAREREFAMKIEEDRRKLDSQERVALAKIEADLIKSREQNAMNAAQAVPDIIPGGL